MRLAVRVAIAACASGLAAPVAQAGEVDREATGAVVVGGGAEDHERGVVAAAVAVAAREAGWSLVAGPIARLDAERLLDCGDPSAPGCVPAAVGSRGIRRIFAFAVDDKQADNGAPMIVLTARLIATAPRALVVRQRFCEHCADDRLADAAIDLARQLVQDVAVRAGRTVLEVASTPPGARITLDGQPIGATDAAFNTFPGAHVVLVEKPGYRSETRSVIAEEGKTSSVAVALAARSVSPATHHLLAGVLAGGGVAAIACAGLLLDLGARGGPDEKYRYTGATPAGIAVGAAGLAALAAAVYVWRAPASGASAASISVTARGAAAGWIVAF